MTLGAINSTEDARNMIVKLLHNHFSTLQIKRPGYSLRAFARSLGVSPSSISEILNGKRNVTRALGTQVIQILGIEPTIANHLIQALPCRTKKRGGTLSQGTWGPPENSGANTTKALAYIQLSTDEFRMIADWYYLAILALAETASFKSNTKWIAKRLGIRTSDASSAVGALVRLGLLQKGEKGHLLTTGKKFTTTNDISDMSLRKNHVQGLELAREAIEAVPVNLREFGASVIAVNSKNLPAAKNLIREMRRKVAGVLETGEKTEVYRLSVQLIPLTKGKKS